jgi:hypothetical protein
MLNTLNACVVVAVAVAATATGCEMSYIPSHEAIAGDGMNIGIWVFLYLFGCMRLGAFAPRKINIYVQIIVKPCIQSRDNGADGPPNTRKALIAAHLAGFRNVSIANTDATIISPCDVNYAWDSPA